MATDERVEVGGLEWAAIERRLGHYREALEWYADERNWTQPTSWGGRIFDEDGAAIRDCGKRARDALLTTGPVSPTHRLSPLAHRREKRG